jgi:hypothetical protein
LAGKRWLNIEMLLASQNEPETKTGYKADDFLKARLAQRPVSVTQLFAEAAEQGINQAALRRAKERWGISSRFVPAEVGHGGSWSWRLPVLPKSKQTQ